MVTYAILGAFVRHAACFYIVHAAFPVPKKQHLSPSKAGLSRWRGSPNPYLNDSPAVPLWPRKFTAIRPQFLTSLIRAMSRMTYRGRA